MAEVTRRSFDLKSWQGLTLVLKVARESNLAPSAYAEFRNLVLEYAQQKGTDVELKKKIDAIIATFDDLEHRKKSEEGGVEAGDSAQHHRRHGRRLVPTFSLRPPREVDPVPVPAPGASEPVVVPQENVPTPTPTHDAPPVAVTPVEKVVATAEPVADVLPTRVEETKSAPVLRSVEEHKVRILEIKRHINSLVGNPATLMDKGNQIGREYMVALLGALKATNPGGTQMLDGAMETLEGAYTKILEYVSHPPAPVAEEEVPAPRMLTDYERPQQPEPETTAPSLYDAEVVTEVREPEPEPEPEPLPPVVPAPVPVEEPVREELPPLSPLDNEREESSLVSPEPLMTRGVVDEPVPEPSHESVPPIDTPDLEATMPPAAPGVEESQDESALAAQIAELKKQLHGDAPGGENRAERTGRARIPSILEMEEEPLPPARVEGTAWDPYGRKPAHAEDLSPAALTKRPASSMTGITLGTPQAELMTPEVTMTLTELLHEWKIFASSGLFGMGPGGIEHPLYVRLARLPMGEVVSGRFDDADMKIVHIIKEYVDAWRHEQGIAYNPTETFEHYLRRVAQRILKRQRHEV
jgi:hypothetical protein